MSENVNGCAAHQASEKREQSPDLLGLAIVAAEMPLQPCPSIPFSATAGDFHMNDSLPSEHDEPDDETKLYFNEQESVTANDPVVQIVEGKVDGENFSDSEASVENEEPERTTFNLDDSYAGILTESEKPAMKEHDVSTDLSVVYESSRKVNRQYKPDCNHYFCRINDTELNRKNEDCLPCPGEEENDIVKRKRIHASYRDSYFKSVVHHIYEKDPTKMRVLPGSYISFEQLGEVQGMFQVDKKDWTGQTPCHFAPNLGSLEMASGRNYGDVHCDCIGCEESCIELAGIRNRNTELKNEVEQQAEMLEQVHVDGQEILKLRNQLRDRDEKLEASELELNKLKFKIGKKDEKLRRVKASLAMARPGAEQATPAKKTKFDELHFKIVDASKKIFDDKKWPNMTIRTLANEKTEYPRDRPPMLDVMLEPSDALPKKVNVKEHQVYYVCYGCGFTATLNKAEAHKKKSPDCSEQWLARRIKSQVWAQEQEKKLREECGLGNIKRAVRKFQAETPELKIAN
ncbi:hypothetical protein HDE_04236 [Halotydeus destructor]|nr:hypothetical protein HDE_04236 [Halotydeus destructor]